MLIKDITDKCPKGLQTVSLASGVKSFVTPAAVLQDCMLRRAARAGEARGTVPAQFALLADKACQGQLTSS